MISRINKLLFLFAVVALCLFIVVLNRETMTISLGRGSTVTANTGVILICTFCIGFVVATLIGIYFGIKSYFREQRLYHREKMRLAFYEGMIKARGYYAAKDTGKARALWEQSVRKDPSDILARVELSKCLEAQGDLKDALRVIDAARAASPQNVEVLFRAAELNTSLGNKTAALDNLALILSTHPCERAAVLAREYSEDLGRIEDALEYQAQVDRFSYDEKGREEIIARLEYKALTKEHGENPAALREHLKTFVKRRSSFVPALKTLAQLEADAGEIDSAALHLVKGAKLSGDESYWYEVSELWMKNRNPQKALSAARSATKETEGMSRLHAELHLIRLFLSLNMLDDAKKALDGFHQLAESQSVEISKELGRSYLSLRGYCLDRIGDRQGALEIWRELSNFDVKVKDPLAAGHFSGNGAAPSPTLSTP